MIRIATWNVNSIRARGDRLQSWLARQKPDVVCLQELKATAEAFPDLELRALGYHAAAHGQKTYNGVAVLSREPFEEVLVGLDDEVDDRQARLISTQIGGTWIISAYFPNGGEPTSPKYVYKLEWMKRLRLFIERRFQPEDRLVIAGDFNVAPDDADIKNPESWRDSVLCRPESREALEEIRRFGFVDVFRKHHPDGGIYSWWDYRMLGFPKNDGLRIDHIFATRPIAAASTNAFVDRDERKGKAPSDHAPVVADFELSAL